MKKFYLLLAGAMLMAGASFGYDFKKYPGIDFSTMSPNGQYLISAGSELMVIYDTKADTAYSYVGEYGESADSINGHPMACMAGYGNPVNNLGMVVGSVSNYDAGFWQNGKWNVLPFPEGAEKGTYSIGHGVTPDGSVICGNISTGSFGDISGMVNTTIFPAVWTRQDDGTYKVEMLPCPTKDIANSYPQYITAVCISDDGKTVAGQIQTGNGYFAYPIVYTKGDDGTWSYKTYGENYILAEGTVLPAYPQNQPSEPSTKDYLTADGLASYQKAYQEYEDSVEMYYAGMVEKYPEYPSYADFLTADSLAAYNAALEEYNKAYSVYSDSLDAYDEVLYGAMTGSGFVYNTVSLSANGRYLAQTLEGDDPNADPLDWFGSKIDRPVLFDLANDGASTEVDATDKAVFSVTNDGMMIACSPALEYMRQAYVVPAGSTTPQLFREWLATKSDTASIWLKDNSSVDFILYDYDEEGNYIETVVPDSVVAGSMVCNADGTVFCSYVYNYFAETEDDALYSLVIDLNNPDTPSGIVSVNGKPNSSLTVKASNGTISVGGDAANVYVYDMAGRKVADAKGAADVAVGSGLYLVKAIDNAGNVTTKKVSVAR